ncbi:DegV family protein [Deinococcus lacus]|uniref:DegV family protein n=1 Tax=Deinococcus lacus TaxID=392561 RepID=A0ABW1YF47_9DEIO
MHFASRYSGSYRAAQQAAALFGGRVQAIDSDNGTYGLALQALRAAQLADQGATLSEIVNDNAGSGNAQLTHFMVDTLDYLKMSGRVSGISAFIGNLFGIKPMLRFSGGELLPAGRARGTARGLQELTQSLSAYAQGQSGRLRLAYIYAPGGEENVAALQAQLSSWGYEDAGTHLVGPTITSVVGPGSVGVVAEAVRPLPLLRR